MSDFPHSALDEYKTQAAILHKQLRSNDQDLAQQAAKRFQQLAHLSSLTVEAILATDTIKRKHALLVIAQEQGFDSWTALKQKLEAQSRLIALRGDYYTMLYPPRCAGYVLEWHSDYDVASSQLGQSSGHLLPYKQQYFICEADYIRELGLDPDDPDWQCIAYNWVHPADTDAWKRLNNKLLAITQSGELN